LWWLCTYVYVSKSSSSIHIYYISRIYQEREKRNLYTVLLYSIVLHPFRPLSSPFHPEKKYISDKIFCLPLFSFQFHCSSSFHFNLRVVGWRGSSTTQWNCVGWIDKLLQKNCKADSSDDEKHLSQKKKRINFLKKKKIIINTVERARSARSHRNLFLYIHNYKNSFFERIF
jgi:hypothetical protein